MPSKDSDSKPKRKPSKTSKAKSSSHNISVEDEEAEVGGYGTKKKSYLNATLLSNYILGISLLKNVAMKFSDEDGFNTEFDQMMGQVLKQE